MGGVRSGGSFWEGRAPERLVRKKNNEPKKKPRYWKKFVSGRQKPGQARGKVGYGVSKEGVICETEEGKPHDQSIIFSGKETEQGKTPVGEKKAETKD